MSQKTVGLNSFTDVKDMHPRAAVALEVPDAHFTTDPISGGLIPSSQALYAPSAPIITVVAADNAVISNLQSTATVNFKVTPRDILNFRHAELEMTATADTGTFLVASFLDMFEEIQVDLNNNQRSSLITPYWAWRNAFTVLSPETLKNMEDSGIRFDLSSQLSFTTTAKTVRVPVLGTILDYIENIKAYFGKNEFFYIRFKIRTSFFTEKRTSAATIATTAFNLRFFQDVVPSVRQNKIDEVHNRNFGTRIWTYPSFIAKAQTLVASTPQTWVNSMLGLFSVIFFTLRPDGYTANNPSIGSDYNSIYLESWEFKSGNTNIQGGNLILPKDKKAEQITRFGNEYSSLFFGNTITVFFCSDFKDDIAYGRRSGNFKMTTSESLVLNPGAAGTNCVLGYTFTGAVTANGGSVTIGWRRPGSKEFHWKTLQYNVSNTDIEEALRDMPNWRNGDLVTFAANSATASPFDGGNTTFTFTFSGGLACTPLNVAAVGESENLVVISALDTTATHNPIAFLPFGSGSTAGVVGTTAGSYQGEWRGYRFGKVLNHVNADSTHRFELVEDA